MSVNENMSQYDQEISQILHELDMWVWSETQPYTYFRDSAQLTLLHRVIASLVEAHSQDPQGMAWLGNAITSQGGYKVGTYPELLRGTCSGITQKGLRCSRTSIIPAESGQGYCSQHMVQIPAVWQSLAPMFSAIGRQVAIRHHTMEEIRNATEGGTVYFIQAGRYLKVGYTDRTPEERLRELIQDAGRQTLTPEGVDWGLAQVVGSVKGTLKSERAYHSLLLKHREVGEWFRLSSELLGSLSGVGIKLKVYPYMHKMFASDETFPSRCEMDKLRSLETAAGDVSHNEETSDGVEVVSASTIRPRKIKGTAA